MVEVDTDLAYSKAVVQLEILTYFSDSDDAGDLVKHRLVRILLEPSLPVLIYSDQAKLLEILEALVGLRFKPAF